MTDRDHFAAAALTGLLARVAGKAEAFSEAAYKIADAMLRERERTNHDAAPAATAIADRYVRRAAADGDSDRTDHAAPRPSDGTGNTPAPPCDESDGSRPISDDRLAALEELSALDQELELKHGIKGNPMIKARRSMDAAKTDTTEPRNGAPSSCEPVRQDTSPPHATPPQGSVPGDGSVRDSRIANEPVAWAVMERDGFGIEGTFTDRDEASEWCDGRQEIVPLYSQPQPTLTNAEREAVGRLACACETSAFLRDPVMAATLRGLLERMK